MKFVGLDDKDTIDESHLFFFFNDPPPTKIYTLPLPAPLPIKTKKNFASPPHPPKLTPFCFLKTREWHPPIMIPLSPPAPEGPAGGRFARPLSPPSKAPACG